MSRSLFIPEVVRSIKRKLNKKVYSVEYTEQLTPVRYYNDGRVTLTYKIEVEVELPKKLAETLTEKFHSKD